MNENEEGDAAEAETDLIWGSRYFLALSPLLLSIICTAIAAST